MMAAFRKSELPMNDDCTRLAKKLKLKQGKLKDIGDGLTDLLDGLPFAGDELEDEFEGPKKKKRKNGDFENPENGNKRKKLKKKVGSRNVEKEKNVKQDIVEDEKREIEVDEQVDKENVVEEVNEENELSNKETAKYVPPHQREGKTTNADMKRRIKGFLNRLSEENIESITSEISELFLVHGRHVITECVTNEIIEASRSGPRGSEQYAAVFAAFVSGIAALVGEDFAAKFMARLATCFEDEYRKQDGLAVRNLSLLVCFIYTFNLVSSELIYDLLQCLCKRFQELDVATILQLMQCCGMSLRSSAPLSMKDFILSVQKKAADIKADSEEGRSKRVKFMLETIFEIKNNKRRPKNEPARHTRIKKWLQKLGVENVQLRSVSWQKLLDPSKKGQWWLPGGTEEYSHSDAIEYSGAADVGEAEKMLQLAAAQRMNTDSRRAVFSIVMTSEDYIDAFQKLLALNLAGKQDREIVRVIIECCLQERVFNKYYALLLTKLITHDKNHKFTLQYCVWDQFKQVEAMEIRRIVNLAKLLASLICCGSLTLSILKSVEFGVMNAKAVLHFRVMLEGVLASAEVSDDRVATIFSPSHLKESSLRDSVWLFIRHHLTAPSLANRCQIVRKSMKG